MPLYEYKCKKCGKVMEKIRKFSDPPLTVHEGCGGELEQLLSSPAIQFKGAGWYVTDYAKKSSVASTNSSSDSSSSSEKSEKSDKSEKKESKSEGKSEAKESTKATEPAKTSKE